MLILRFFEIVIMILMVMFVSIFTICGIAISLTKNTINNMMEFKGDRKDE